MRKLSKKYDPKNTKSLKSIEILSEWMDSKFTIPFTDIKFGVDPLLNLLPGIGDTISSGINLSIFGLILLKGVPTKTAFKMMLNTVTDTLLSAIPFLGIVVDIGYKSNTRNLRLLEQHLQNNPDGKYHYGAWVIFGLTVLIVFLLITAILLLTIYAVSKIEPMVINW